jgi:hypothetical protein
MRTWIAYASGLVFAGASVMACGGPEPVTSTEHRHCVALTVHLGLVEQATLTEELRSALWPVAENGGTLRVWRATRSAASLDPLIRDRAVPRPRGEDDRVAEAAGRTVDGLVREVLDATARTGARQQGAPGVEEAEQVDLFGALRKMGREAKVMTGCGHKDGIVVSGGGIHRSEELDLLDVPPAGGPVSMSVARDIAVPKIVAPPGVSRVVET